MRPPIYHVLLIILMYSVSNGCRNHQENKQLKELDKLLKIDAPATLKPLNAIDPAQLGHPDLCYYYLLKASAIDRSYTKLIDEDIQLRVSEKYYSKTKDYYNLARTEYYIAKCLLNRDSIKAGYSMLKKAMENFEKTDQSDPHLGGLIYYQLGNRLNGPEDFPISKIYFEKSQEMFFKAHDTIASLYAITQAIRIEYTEGNLKKAESLADEILQRINSLKNIPERQLADIKRNAYYIISDLYFQGTDIPKALAFNREAIDIFRDHKIPTDLYQNLAVLFHRQQQIDSARYYYNLAVDTTSMPQSAYYLSNIYIDWAILEDQQGNYKAASQLKDKYIKTINIWRDNRENYSKQAFEEKHNKTLHEKAVLKDQYRKSVILGVCLCILFVGTVIFLIFFKKHHALRINFNGLTDKVQYAVWGFSVMQELISECHIMHHEIDGILMKNRTAIKDPPLYKQLYSSLLDRQKEYTSRLFSTLTDFDSSFVSKLKSEVPDITNNDMILAVMVRHKWTVSKIAAILQINENTARKRKSRLKNKILGGKASLEDLEEHLERLVSNKGKDIAS